MSYGNYKYSGERGSYPKAPYASNGGYSQNENRGFQPANSGSNQRVRKSAPIGVKMVNGRELPVYKKSGAKTGITKNGGKYTNGWRVKKGMGLTTFFCAPTKNTQAVSSKTGRNWLTSISVKIVNADMALNQLAWGIMDAQTGMVIIQDLGLVINPKAPNGGVVAVIGRK